MNTDINNSNNNCCCYSNFQSNFHCNFKKTYLRNNKSNGSKNLRCFPECSACGHKKQGFCGQDVQLDLYFDCHRIPVQIDELLFAAEFKVSTNKDDFTENEIAESLLLKNSRPPNRKYYLPQKLMTHTKYNLSTSEVNTAIRMQFESRPWHYDWTGTKRDQSVRHCLAINVFAPVQVLTPSEYSSGSDEALSPSYNAQFTLRRIAELHSTEFKVSCVRRAQDLNENITEKKTRSIDMLDDLVIGDDFEYKRQRVAEDQYEESQSIYSNDGYSYQPNFAMPCYNNGGIQQYPMQLDALNGSNYHIANNPTLIQSDYYPLDANSMRQHQSNGCHSNFVLQAPRVQYSIVHPPQLSFRQKLNMHSKRISETQNLVHQGCLMPPAHVLQHQISHDGGHFDHEYPIMSVNSSMAAPAHSQHQLYYPPQQSEQHRFAPISRRAPPSVHIPGLVRSSNVYANNFPGCDPALANFSYQAVQMNRHPYVPPTANNINSSNELVPRRNVSIEECTSESHEDDLMALSDDLLLQSALRCSTPLGCSGSVCSSNLSYEPSDFDDEKEADKSFIEPKNIDVPHLYHATPTPRNNNKTADACSAGLSSASSNIVTPNAPFRKKCRIVGKDSDRKADSQSKDNLFPIKGKDSALDVKDCQFNDICQLNNLSEILDHLNEFFTAEASESVEQHCALATTDYLY